MRVGGRFSHVCWHEILTSQFRNGISPERIKLQSPAKAQIESISSSLRICICRSFSFGLRGNKTNGKKDEIYFRYCYHSQRPLSRKTSLVTLNVSCVCTLVTPFHTPLPPSTPLHAPHYPLPPPLDFLTPTEVETRVFAISKKNLVTGGWTDGPTRRADWRTDRLPRAVLMYCSINQWKIAWISLIHLVVSTCPTFLT